VDENNEVETATTLFLSPCGYLKSVCQLLLSIGYMMQCYTMNNISNKKHSYTANY